MASKYGIAGDSILNGIEENCLKKNLSVKVRSFPGSNIDDMYDYLKPLLKKKPSYIIIHVRSNDAPFKTSSQILDEMKNLIAHIESVLPSAIVYLSCPILRFDDAKAKLTLHHLIMKMQYLPNMILHDNVDKSCLGKKGAHLNPKGSGRLAINFLSLMRRL